jgi:hypothetical protein
MLARFGQALSWTDVFSSAKALQASPLALALTLAATLAAALAAGAVVSESEEQPAMSRASVRVVTADAARAAVVRCMRDSSAGAGCRCL